MPDIGRSEPGISSDENSDDGIVNATVEVGEDSTSNDIIAVNDFFIIEMDDATKTFGFFDSRDACVKTDRQFIFPSVVTDFVFWRENGIGSKKILLVKICFFS